MKKYLFLPLIMILSLFITSCSDLKKEEIKKSELSDSRFEVACELNVEGLHKIMTERVDNEINCLRDWLLLFSSVVKSDRPGEMGIQELKQFLDGGLGPDVVVSPGIINALDAIYELNYLIGSGNREYVTADQLNDLMDIIIIFNEEIIPVYLELSQDRKVSYNWHQERRREMYQSIERIAKIAKEKINRDRANIDEVNLLVILNAFTSKDESSIIETIKDFLIVKKIILGGKINILNYKELYQLFEKAPAIMTVVYDILQLTDIEFNGPIEVLDFGNHALTNLGRDIIVNNKKGEEKLFSIRDFESYFKIIFDKPISLDFFQSPPFIKLIKNALFGEGDYFTDVQLRGFVSYLRSLLQKLQYFFKIYQENEAELSPTSGLKVYKLSNTKPTNPREREYIKEFRVLLQKYLFFRQSFKTAAVYDNKTNRSAYGIVEYALFESLGEKLFGYWERAHPCDSLEIGKKDRCKKEDYTATLDKNQFRGVVGQIADYLVKNNVIGLGRENATADSVWQLADLFLVNSNGDLKVDRYELAEFGVLLFSTYRIYKNVFERVRTSCATNYKSWIEPDCFKEKFLEKMFESNHEDGLNVAKYLPRLDKYVKDSDDKTLTLMVEGADGYTRNCKEFKNGEPVYLSSGDVYLMLAGMLNIESAIVRFDKNHDNYIDPNEFNGLFDVFYNVVDSSIKAMGKVVDFIIGEKYMKKILRYIFMEHEEPSKVMTYIKLFGKDQNFHSDVNREDFTNVLRVLGSGDPLPVDFCERYR